MSWNDLDIADLENIPNRYLVSWKFINAFLVAFQERADFIEGANRAATYDDLILNNSQILTGELSDRLAALNDGVISCFNSSWLKEDSWKDLKGFSAELMPPRVGRGVPGLGVLFFEYWTEADIRSLLTDEVYDDIFTNYSYGVSFKNTYWSGLYKLLKYVLRYRKLTLATFYDPTYEEPVLFLNDGETLSETADNLNLSSLTSKTTTKTNNGTAMLKGGFVLTESEYFVGNANNVPVETETDFCRVSYEGLRKNPFCKTPAQMDIETLLWRERGDLKATIDIEKQQGNIKNFDSRQEITEPIPASEVRKIVDYDREDPVWNPDINTFASDRAENPKLSISYTGSQCEVNISSLKDIRTDYTINPDKAKKPELDFAVGTATNESDRNQTIRNYLNFAMCALPQDAFEFPV